MGWACPVSPVSRCGQGHAPHLALRCAGDGSAPQPALGRCIREFVNELFVFIEYPHVPPGSNSERSLRVPLVAGSVTAEAPAQPGAW